jgi:hypothetical protein
MFAGVGAARPHMDARRTRVDAHVPRATLRNGVTMPLVAAGTWQYPPDQAESVGFEHIDTAFNYRNQVRGFRLARWLAATLSASIDRHWTPDDTMTCVRVCAGCWDAR